MKDISFEKAMEKLEKIVEELESGDLALDASLKKYEEGIKLSRLCRQKLDKAKQKVEVLTQDSKGEFSVKDFKGNDEDK